MTFAASLGAAVAYDRWFESRWGRYAFEVEAHALLRAAGHPRGRRYADVGCGTGRLTRLLEARGAYVVGVDNDAAMLAVAREQTGVRLLLGDAAALPLPDASFDAAFAVTVCEFVDNVAQVFAELARITRPGGRFVVGGLNPRSPWGWASRRRFSEPPWVTARFLTRDELVHLGRRHGRASLTASLYAFESLPALSVTGRLLEALGRLTPHWGAFQVLTVDLPGS
jgi:SAM-dependent methyltransferase